MLRPLAMDAPLIHPTAIIHPSAQLDAGVQVGPYCVIEANVALGAGTVLGPHVVILANSTLGQRCTVASGAVIGGLPQDHGFGGEPSGVLIGDDVVIRECVTINRATGDSQNTIVGDGCMIMAYSHLAHNCHLGHRVILANNVQLAGYVSLGDDAFIGGTCVVHQFVTIGRLTIMGGFTGTRQDLPPFAMTEGRPATVRGINTVGLKRKGFSLQARTQLKQAYHTLFFSQHNTTDAIEALRATMPVGYDANVDELVAFLKQSKRGIRRADRESEATV
jgi:UDP-N-acetylglucosamine acyltransferase